MCIGPQAETRLNQLINMDWPPTHNILISFSSSAICVSGIGRLESSGGVHICNIPALTEIFGEVSTLQLVELWSIPSLPWSWPCSIKKEIEGIRLLTGMCFSPSHVLINLHLPYFLLLSPLSFSLSLLPTTYFFQHLGKMANLLAELESKKTANWAIWKICDSAQPSLAGDWWVETGKESGKPGTVIRPLGHHVNADKTAEDCMGRRVWWTVGSALTQTLRSWSPPCRKSTPGLFGIGVNADIDLIPPV